MFSLKNKSYWSRFKKKESNKYICASQVWPFIVLIKQLFHGTAAKVSCHSTAICSGIQFKFQSWLSEIRYIWSWEVIKQSSIVISKSTEISRKSSESHQMAIRYSSERHQRVIRKSSESHQKVIRRFIWQPSDSHQTAIRQQIRKTSGSRQNVIK